MTTPEELTTALNDFITECSHNHYICKNVNTILFVRTSVLQTKTLMTGDILERNISD